MSEHSRTVTLAPEQAYGPHDPQLVNVMSRAELPGEIDLEVGTVLKATKPDGSIARLVVSEFDDNNVTVDANHVMAGKTLIFQLSLVGFVN